MCNNNNNNNNSALFLLHKMCLRAQARYRTTIIKAYPDYVGNPASTTLWSSHVKLFFLT